MGLPPLIWLVHDYAALQPDGRVHRLGCPDATRVGRLLRPADRLARRRAPEPCPHCRPRLETRLSD